MNEMQFAQALAGMLDDNRELVADDGTEATVRRYPRLFSESGMLTMNEGITVQLADGSEFQLTVVQSAYADER